MLTADKSSEHASSTSHGMILTKVIRTHNKNDHFSSSNPKNAAKI